MRPSVIQAVTAVIQQHMRPSVHILVYETFCPHLLFQAMVHALALEENLSESKKQNGENNIEQSRLFVLR